MPQFILPEDDYGRLCFLFWGWKKRRNNWKNV